MAPFQDDWRARHPHGRPNTITRSDWKGTGQIGDFIERENGVEPVQRHGVDSVEYVAAPAIDDCLRAELQEEDFGQSGYGVGAITVADNRCSREIRVY